ncbi:two component transcriptional regulator, LytTR family [Prevotella aff. ruminicola Tc2-24]|uniref:Two component transcriptional regulator, LytTR family n=1 Tax=Prevotella aff. ruminicola Tc2-24 TaxID=81582 RepID=A0A1I0P3L3_9BACT|nr:LytTR family DNA-binding domain-containing protein [Prevotella aff. ruminicola Tc2-24]SEW08857.1 two component transcriptional regulator, LytTR family [Prevotella aff. ruminicola Tc2-24]
MKLSCMIVDDEPLAVKLLESFVAKTPDLELLGSFTDSVEAINAIKERKPQLLFLDIQMPDLNGMELAHMLPEGTRIIFTTAFKEYAFESYEVFALDFLLKPIRYNKFIAAVEKAREWYLTRSTQRAEEPGETSTPQVSLSLGEVGRGTLFLKVDGEYRQIALDKILYVSGLKDYVMFYLDGDRKPLITHLTMKSVEEMLPPSRFMRVHRSYIVALDKIRSVDRNDCIYIGDEIIRVTDAFRNTFNQYLQARLFDKRPNDPA